MVDFFSPMRGACTELAPHWGNAAKWLRGVVNFGSVDVTSGDGEILAQRFEITEYPTILVFHPDTGTKQSSVDKWEWSDSFVSVPEAGDIVRFALSEVAAIVMERQARPLDAGDDDTSATAAGASQDIYDYTIEIDGDANAVSYVAVPEVVGVAIVGAGPAGIGSALALKAAGVDLNDVIILERGVVGETFRRWPKEMRWITPSFYGNPFKQVDLNAVDPNSSPAYINDTEHPNGPQYQDYLAMLRDFYDLPVHEHTEVYDIVPSTNLVDGRPLSGFNISIAASEKDAAGEPAHRQTIFAQHVIWAGGMFQNRVVPSIPGAEFGLHNGIVNSWTDLKKSKDELIPQIVVLGGYESGIDAASNLIELNIAQKVIVMDSSAPWSRRKTDPSLMLAPVTIERLNRADETGRLTLVAENAMKIDKQENNNVFLVSTESGLSYNSHAAPILATGFSSRSPEIADLMGWEPNDFAPSLNSMDESTKTPGLFMVGPGVYHKISQGEKDKETDDGQNELEFIFCFLYKFRARFPVVASAIADRLGIAKSIQKRGLQDYRDHGMFMDELSPSASCACRH